MNIRFSKMTLFACMLCALLSSGHSRADSFAIVANPALLDDISFEKLGHLFLGRSVEAANGVTLTPIYVSDNEELHQLFTRKVLNRSTSQLRSYLAKKVFTGKAKPPINASNITKLKEMLKENPGFIGYLPLDEYEGELRILYVFDG